MGAIFKREIKAYMTSFFTWFYYAVYFLVTGLLFAYSCLANYNTQFGYYVLSKSFAVVILVLPLCTMRVFSQERRNRSDQLLFTAPVTAFGILMGKYLATLICVLLPVIGSVIFPLIIWQHGTMQIPFLLAGYIAVLTVTILAAAVGTFFSTLTSNSILAAVFTYAAYAFVLLTRIVEGIFTKGSLYDMVHDASVYNHYNAMISGIVRPGNVIYILLLTVLFLMLAFLVLESRRKNYKIVLCKAIAVVLIAVAGSVLSLGNPAVVDCTPQKILTLSDTTISLLDTISKPTTIYYMGTRNRANATYQELLQRYALENENISVEYKDVSTDQNFRAQYLSSVDQIQEASMLVVCGERCIYLDASDYVSTVQTGTYSKSMTLELEDQLTSAIWNVNQTDSQKIYMVMDHGEQGLTQRFRTALQIRNYTLEEISLSEEMLSLNETFNEDGGVLWIHAPEEDYTEDELAFLEQYLKDGGNLYVSIDPLNEDLKNLYGFLEKHGLKLVDGVVIEGNAQRYVYDTGYYLAPNMADTDITDTLVKDKRQVLTMTSKGIEPGGKAGGYVCEDLLLTSAKSYSKVTDFDNLDTKADEDIQGPFSVASYASKEGAGNIFLLASDVFYNAEVDTASEGANRAFLLAVLNRMTGNSMKYVIPGKEMNNQTALYSNAFIKAMRIGFVVVMPLLFLLTGVAVIWIRHDGMKRMHRRKENRDEQ